MLAPAFVFLCGKHQIMNKLTTILIFIFGWVVSVFALPPSYSFLRIKNSDGLVNNQTTCIFKDSRGFMWFGTSSGLSRFDGSNFKNYIHIEEDSTSLIDNFIQNIQEDATGNLWIKTRWYYTIYDFKNEAFIKFNHFLQKKGINEPIEDVYIDKNKKIWYKTQGYKHFQYFDTNKRKLIDPFSNGSVDDIELADFYHDGKNYYNIYTSGIIECFNGNNFNLMFRNKDLQGKLGNDSVSTLIFVDKESDIWVYGAKNGIYLYQTNTKRWQHFTTETTDLQLSNNITTKIAQDKNGNIWIGTDHGGLDIINKYTKTVQPLYYKPDVPNSISQNSITDIFVDNIGIIWIGTYKEGICYYHESIYKFAHYQNFISDKNSLPYNDVNCFAEDANGNLWIGTNGGGLIYFDRAKNTFTTFKHEASNPNSLSNNVIVNILIDNTGLLWIGTYTGGLSVFDGKKFKNFTVSNQDKNGLKSNSIWTLVQDKNNRIWMGTLGGGISVYDKENEAFITIPNQGGIQLPTDFVSHIHLLRSGDLFIGTAKGIVFYNMKENRFCYNLLKNSDKPFNISNDNVLDVFEDSRGLLWVGTREGLSVLNPQTDFVKLFKKKDGLAEDIFNCIQEDDYGALWLSKSSGLSQLIVKQQDGEYLFSINNFTESDGLQGREFNVNASCKTRNGELIFGGPNGFNLFQPQDIKQDTISPKIVLTDFQIFNQSIKAGEWVEKKVILQNSITVTKKIKIKHSLNVFSIEFAALNTFNNEKIRYRYILEGFNEKWIDADDNVRKVTYTNLNSGTYIFKVQASNTDGVWNEEYASLQIVILPPLYKTSFAYILYISLFIGGLIYFRYTMLNKERAKFNIEQERLQAKRNHELDEVKFRFLTNVSHEFRTPLTLILTPLDKLLKTIKEPSDQKLLKIIERNAQQLLNLVNQLLDFRKLELYGLRFNPSFGDIISFLTEVCDNFTESFQRKNINFEFVSTIKSLNCQFDHEKIQRIVMNLLSNALKFTPEKGSVSLTFEVVSDAPNKQTMQIKVIDSGLGIKENEREKIFERFYQSKNAESLGGAGSGIGLNLAREMVLLHNGTISVESQLGKGSVFTVSLPIIHEEAVSKEEKAITLVQQTIEHEEIEAEIEKYGQRQSVVLVEDNIDFRTFMKDTLQERYTVYEAGNGQDGYELIHKKLPDLIISDIMMPGTDGLAMCSQLKSDLRTSHIPLIMLTARTADEDKIKGLEIGADDYITKPFKMDLLLLRIQNLMDKRSEMQKQFQKKMEINPSEIEISSIDEKLINKALALVEKNIADADFSVEDLSRELGMSRVYLYKKLMAITGKSPIEFIRIIRLKRGEQLLIKSQKTISEIAYEVGFNNPRYFSKYFKEEYGMLPSEYVNSL